MGWRMEIAGKGLSREEESSVHLNALSKAAASGSRYGEDAHMRAREQESTSGTQVVIQIEGGDLSGEVAIRKKRCWTSVAMKKPTQERT